MTGSLRWSMLMNLKALGVSFAGANDTRLFLVLYGAAEAAPP
jgi:hypothetical protein